MAKQRLHEDLEKLRNENTGGEVQDEGVLTSVREAIEHFETDHPRATAILNDIMVTLSNMGI